MSPEIKQVLEFNTLYKQYSQRFIRFARGYVMANEVAEDIVNDSYMYLWENRNNIKEENLSGYLLTVVKHKCINYLKRSSLEDKTVTHYNDLENWEMQLKIESLESLDSYDLLSDEIQRLANKAMRSMPIQTREIIIRSRYQSQSNKEIAEAMGLSVKTVEYHITKALKILRVVLKDYFPIWLILFSK